MKKIDLLIAALFMIVGVMCLAFSATYYGNNLFMSDVGYVKTACMWVVLLGAAVYLIFLISKNKRNKRNKK
ncbi:hypothetical protein [Paenibacillus guangzhouensis]|uniref:hypothetical protein n=1 Tax=Paenibacillus guangzhouensis TaxID=1473112 RepID=UPI0012668C0F|nr:hypothetical protein [Paenibacillus guangzhouensis]